MDPPKQYNAAESEPKWQDFWEKNKIYKFDPKSKREIYSVDTPPPTVSGAIHMGHAFSYSHTDFIVRFQRMQGKNIFYPFGFDNNGLATERLVEKEQKIKATKMPREKFVKVCLEVSEKYEKVFKDFWSRLGLSCDWTLLYSTIDPWCRKTSQRSFIELYKNGREYRKKAPTIWCPECQTAIAQVELEDKYLDSCFNHVVFKVDNKDLVIATTRPELLPACVAVFAHPDDKRYKSLIGRKAKVPLFDLEVPIFADKRADPEKGTGIVMCCTFGDQTDMEWYSAFNLPLRIVITPGGKMNELAGKYEGLSLHEARTEIINDLKKNKLLLKQVPINHAVNVHERCGTEAEFLVTEQWFIKYLDLKNKFLELGEKLNWYPEHMKVRYDNWIKGLQWDWCISRQRYSGVPFPVWYCKKCNEIILADEKQLPVDPLNDKPLKPCKCGSTDFEPEKDILDTWATSSLTPQINTKWKEDEKLFKKLFPMSLRPQAHDIITFWLFNTIVKAYLHNNQLPWKDVMISGHGLDPHGKKMSKSKGNIINPIELLKKSPADCLRFWAAGSKLGDDFPYQEKDLVTCNKMITKLWNAAKFCIMHLQDFDPSSKKIKLEEIDKWALSKLHTLIKDCTDSFNVYEYSKIRLDTEKFFWHSFCDNYLELVKYRLYNPDVCGPDSRKAAQFTLYNLLLAIIKLTAPIMPFITEEIYHAYFAEKEKCASVHVSKWPEFNKKLLDKDAEEGGDLAIDIISAVRRFKSQKNMSLKAPVKNLVIKCKEKSKLEPFISDIKATVAAEKIEFGEKAEIECNKDVKINIEI